MTTLNQQLATLRAEKDAKRDPAATELMNRATAELEASGIMDRIARVGQRAPLFARPNLEGDTVRLRSLLGSGPVVLSFFRGRW